jgi:hypothetical protein
MDKLLSVLAVIALALICAWIGVKIVDITPHAWREYNHWARNR